MSESQLRMLNRFNRRNPRHWVLEERVRYRSKHRAMDHKLVDDLWPSPITQQQSTKQQKVVHIRDAPRKIQKQWKRAVAVHGSCWIQKMEEMSQLYIYSNEGPPDDVSNVAEFYKIAAAQSAKIVPATTTVISYMKKQLPNAPSTTTLYTDVSGGRNSRQEASRTMEPYE